MNPEQKRTAVPSTSPLTNTLASPALAMPELNRTERVPQHTIGRSGRVWSLPGPYEVPNVSGCLPHMLANESAVVDNLVLFLAQNAPELSFMWQGELMQRGLDSATRLNAAYGRLLEKDRLQAIPEAPRDFAPTRVAIPSLGERHWAWQRHYELGHGVSSSLFDPQPGETAAQAMTREAKLHRERSAEAGSDLATITDYLSRYHELAACCTGERLARAVEGSLLKAPYQTCMQICLLDLGLPAHFMALIHYGMGVEFVMRGDSCAGAKGTLDRLAKLYQDDFAA